MSKKALYNALKDLVDVNDRHNQAIMDVTGKPLGWKDTYLDAARIALKEASDVKTTMSKT